MSISPLEYDAPAKINLHLRVGPARADGFHPLLTWMVTVGLCDTVHISNSEVDTFTCSDPTLPMDGQNLVVRAMQLMRHTRLIPPISVHLQKRIPTGGGLGGGSSDAATMLMALDRLFPLAAVPGPVALAPLAARLGSDVPFFLYGPSSWCRGRGEAVEPTSAPRQAKWAVLMLPAIAVPTAEAYRVFDDMGLGDERAVTDVVDTEKWADLTATDLLDRLVNDLEPPAFQMRPQLGELCESLRHRLGRAVRLSGSGSSLFTLYDDGPQAAAAAAKVDASVPGLRAIAVKLSVSPGNR